jgi:ATP-binding cassette subfamily B protein/subfamily B ATP-binding cassette protein MsbA
MNNYHDEEVLGKGYDSKLMTRMLTYAKPYWIMVVFSIFLLLIITATDLAMPYIVKVAIDEYINVYDRPMIEVSPLEVEGHHSFHYKDMVFVRETPPLKESFPNNMRYQLVQRGNTYYLLEGVLDRERDFSIEEENGIYYARQDGLTIYAIPLTREEVKIFRHSDVNAITWLAFLLLGALLLGFGLNYLQVYILSLTSQRIIFNMREEIFTHLQYLHLSYFDKNPIGRLVTRVTNDTETLNEMYTSVMVNLFRDVFLLVGIVVIMLRLHFNLALITLSVMPLVILSYAIFRLKARAAYREVRKLLARINSTLSENISGMRVVQIFNQEKKKFKEFDEINQSHMTASYGELRIFAVFRPVINILYFMALSLVVWYGGRGVLRGNIEFGVVFAFISYVQIFFRPINDLSEKYNILQGAMASSERIFQLIDTKPGVKNGENPIRIRGCKGKIEFKNVWFAYNEGEWVLRDVSFVIEPGNKVAFVGATGAGKSSIMSLLTRFYDIQRGQILLDDIDIRDIDLKDLRTNISVVLQDVFLFTGDISSNIRLNNNNITDGEIKEICRIVNADKFIEKLPNKYHELVTERGSTLSVGQRQLLSFARALAFDPKVLILDEATASIDTETELLIQDALPRLMEGRTNIIVAHRLSTIQHADKIIVLKKGKIREMGTHQELLNKQGIYYELYKLQYEDFNKE